MSWTEPSRGGFLPLPMLLLVVIPLQVAWIALLWWITQNIHLTVQAILNTFSPVGLIMGIIVAVVCFPLIMLFLLLPVVVVARINQLAW